MESLIQSLLTNSGMATGFAYPLALMASVVVLVLITALVGFIGRIVIFKIILRLVLRSNTEWDDFLFTKAFFRHLNWVLQFVIAYVLLWYLIPETAPTFTWLRRILLATITMASTAAAFTFLSNIVVAFQQLKGKNNIPVKSYAQVAKILLGLVAAVLVISFLAEQSPVGVLSGIGALTAVLLLVFKDSLLGFLASMQISTQDMVKVGDWIEIPAQNIDGEVQDISLNVIKIRNWDNTVTSIPTYNIVSGSFKNWRQMKETGGRRIKRSLPLDSTSIRLVDKAMEARLSGLPRLAGYLDAAAKPEHPGAAFRSLTNLGAFRVYAQAYLESHPDIHPDMTRTVRQLENQGRGLPLECIFFSRDTTGAATEALLSEVFEHLYAMLPLFDLRVFQEATGHDLRR